MKLTGFEYFFYILLFGSKGLRSKASETLT